ncbi:hypothetical protein [Algoriphagus sp. A40]|uniref:hypothetical protein n=1 Tax=Algoriphagus sp. A40 TaxID=1945863 RepID=UPI000984D76A|nr:hypothetical protein [Algoriphagus sp. A40]OOG78439.1 hypothetical protein B0E43_01915 [Algoriphagus sp. A40]
MPFTPQTFRPSFEVNPKLAKAAHNLSSLLIAIGQKSITPGHEQKINEMVAGVNDFSSPDPELLKHLTSVQVGILKLLENDLQIVAKNHYQGQWLAIGMAAFGIPLGVAFGASLGNMAFMGLGLPIGMGIGIAVGTAKDTQALQEGRQLNWISK